MFENIPLWVYPLTGFTAAYIPLELAWHFTACKIKTAKPCVFKQVRMLVVAKSR
jgi:hypothetical protein